MRMGSLPVLWAGLLASVLAAAPRQMVEVVTTQRADLSPGGTIRVEGSTGELNIEGWDQAQVEVIVTRYGSWPETKRTESAAAKPDTVRLVKETNGELTVSTAHKRSFGTHLDYQIMVPRNSHIVVHHRIGDVFIHGVAGNIEATAKVGDILLQLPAQAHYTFDTHTRIGGVYTDYKGQGSSVGAAPKAYLRVGIGGITVQSL